jgi:hypothetical protein
MAPLNQLWHDPYLEQSAPKLVAHIIIRQWPVRLN